MVEFFTNNPILGLIVMIILLGLGKKIGRFIGFILMILAVVVFALVLAGLGGIA